MMSSLSNKNKRRGYKEAPAVLPAKIVFGDETNAAAGSSTSATVPTTGVAAPVHLPRLVSPSERQENGDIPESWRLFVSSVDVENGMTRRGKKRKQKLAQAWNSQLDELDDAKVAVTLDYGTVDDEVEEEAEAAGRVAPLIDSKSTSLNWNEIEQQLSTLLLVDTLALLKPGVIVAWKVSGFYRFCSRDGALIVGNRRAWTSTQSLSRQSSSSMLQK
jgi:hypothetical protein